jgi:hypothetical protein
MNLNRIKWAMIALFAFALCACQGPDPIRLRSERANLALAQRCAEGWFTGLPWTEHDRMLVLQSFGDWERALAADEKLLGWPAPGGAK